MHLPPLSALTRHPAKRAASAALIIVAGIGGPGTSACSSESQCAGDEDDSKQIRITMHLEKVDRETGARTTLPVPSSARRTSIGHTVAGGGKLYWIGGIDEAMHESCAADVYDPTTKEWKSLPSIPRPREAFLAFVAGKVCMGPGRYLNLQSEVTEVEYENGRYDCYDPTEDAWTTLPTEPGDTIHPSFGVDDHRIVAIGGGDHGDGCRGDGHLYDFDTGEWVALPSYQGCGGETVAMGANFYNLTRSQSSNGPPRFNAVHLALRREATVGRFRG